MTPEELTRRLTADPARTGLFLDFDGTLSDIVEDPATSRLPGALEPVLGDLTGRLALVAVISGRPASFLAQRVPVPGVRLLGLYGLEEVVDGAVESRPEAAEWKVAVDDARRRLPTAVGGMAGVHVEDKGLSIAVHWRHAPDREEAGRDVMLLVESLAADTGLAHEPGKFVAELRPPVEWDKGSAVAAVADELALSRLAYVGDDLGDLPAFAAAREHGGVAAGVVHGAETPSQLRDAVDLVFDGPDAVAAWLTTLREALGD